MPRWYLKCHDCLIPIAIDSDRRPTDPIACACGGRLEFMGRVRRTRVVVDSERCPCDGRCTGATGPSCDCQCGGENHGSGRVVRVELDAGKARIVATAPSAQIERAAAYRAALAELDAAIRASRHAPALEAIRAGAWTPGWHAAQAVASERRRVRAMQSHTGRLKAIARLTEDLRARRV